MALSTVSRVPDKMSSKFLSELRVTIDRMTAFYLPRNDSDQPGEGDSQAAC